MKRVFISYSRSDVDFARLLATALSDAGADVWIDVEDIPAGMKWSRAIQQGLDTAEAMLVVISPEAIASHNVEDEWQYFMDQGKPVIPIWWKPARMPFQLNRLQYIDFQGQGFDSAFAKLLGEMNRRGVPLETQALESSAAAAIPASAQPQLPPRASAKSRPVLPLFLSGLVLVLLLVGAIVLFGELLGGNAASLDEFLADPMPAVQTDGNTPFPVHDSASGTSSANRSFTQASIPLRTYDETNEYYWFQLDSPEGDTGYQITDMLLNADAVPEDLLAIVPLAINLAPDERELSLYLAPTPDSGSVDVEVEEVALIYGYALDDESTVWWSLEASLSDGELVRGWYAGDESVLGDVPALATVQEPVAVYEDNLLDAPDAAPVTELAAGTDVRVLYYDSDSGDDDVALIATYRPIPGEWQVFWMWGDDLRLNDETLNAIEANPVAFP